MVFALKLQLTCVVFLTLTTLSANTVHADHEPAEKTLSTATSHNSSNVANDGVAHGNTTKPKQETSVNQTVPKNAYKLKVTGYTMITPRVLKLTLKRSDGSPFDFIAGQFVTFLLPHEGKLVRRSYSLANSPEQADELEVAIAPVHGGFATQILFNLTVGDELWSVGPAGRLTLGKTDNVSHLLLVATGTGVAPYRSMLPAIAKKLDEDRNLTVTVLLGVRQADELLYAEDFIKFAEKYKNFHFRGCLSRAQKLTSPYQHSGYVQTTFHALNLNPSIDLVYLCGNPRMIDDSVHKLTEMGFKSQRLIREKYVSRGV